MWLWFKTALFSIFVPGTVAIYLPLLITGNRLSNSKTLLPGFLLCIAGVSLYLWCAATFVLAGQGTPAPVDEPKKFVAVGPYTWSRNPMYVAVLTTILGQALISLSWGLLAYAAFVFACVTAFVKFYEEPHLRKKFGSDYEHYFQKTPRWIGR